MDVQYFLGKDSELYITEFGFSAPEGCRVVGPRIREDNLVHFVVSGSGSFCGEKIKSSDAFLIRSGVVHDFSTDEGYEHYWIGFGGTKASRLLDLLGFSRSCGIYGLYNAELVKNRLEEAFSSCKNEADGERLAMSALLSLLALFETERGGERAPRSREYPLRAAEFIDRNLHRPLKIEEVAEHIMVSEKHLCRLFKSYYGIPPQRYMIEKKLAKAANLLRDTELLVCEVSRSVGYESQLEFSRIFKQYTGKSPMEYRAERRE